MSSISVANVLFNTSGSARIDYVNDTIRLIGNYNFSNGNIIYNTTNVVSATYGGSTQIPVFTVDSFGRLTYAANVAVNGMDYPYANAVGIAANNYANATFATRASPTFTGTINMASANLTSQTLTDAASISWDISLGTIATVTLGGNRTLSNPTNLKVGTFILHVIQDGVGGRTLGYGSAFKWPAGVAPVLTTTAGARDVLSFVCDGTNLYGSFLPDVK